MNKVNIVVLLVLVNFFLTIQVAPDVSGNPCANISQLVCYQLDQKIFGSFKTFAEIAVMFYNAVLYKNGVPVDTINIPAQNADGSMRDECYYFFMFANHGDGYYEISVDAVANSGKHCWLLEETWEWQNSKNWACYFYSGSNFKTSLVHGVDCDVYAVWNWDIPADWDKSELPTEFRLFRVVEATSDTLEICRVAINEGQVEYSMYDDSIPQDTIGEITYLLMSLEPPKGFIGEEQLALRAVDTIYFDKGIAVELTNFVATVTDRQVVIHWSGYERNHAYYNLWRLDPGASEYCSLNDEPIRIAGDNLDDQIAEAFYSWCDLTAPAGTLFYKLEAVDLNGVGSKYGPVLVDYTMETIIAIPLAYELLQNYPNPFNPMTTIEFSLPADLEVTLEIYDMLGKKVATLAKESYCKAGWHQIQFDAMSANLKSGAYFYRLTAGEFMAIRRMILIK